MAPLRLPGQQGAADRKAVTRVAAAKDARECLTYAREERDRRYAAAVKDRLPWTDSLDTAVTTAIRELARECLLRFPLKEAKLDGLKPVAQLYAAAGLTDSARMVARLWMSRATNDTARAAALDYAIWVLPPTERDSGTVASSLMAEAESLLDQIDALGSAFSNRAFIARRHVAGAYREQGRHDKNVAHLSRALALIPKLSAADRQGYPHDIALTYIELAESYRALGQPDQAKTILSRGLEELADFKPQQLVQLRSTALVDNPAPRLVATHWFNAPEGTTELDLKGKVSLVMISAHWCGPCQNSYPSLQRLFEKYRERGLNVVVTSGLWGYYEDKKDVSPEEELAYSQTYFLKKHRLTVPVALDVPSGSSKSDSSRLVPGHDRISQALYASAYPTFFLIDRNGIIRKRYVGFNETKLIADIEKLLRN
jgi:thiol-disulfide isomerase/thioredoxin